MARYKVGDKLRVRSWNSMVKEFGYASNSKDDFKIIAVPKAGFTEPMRYMCGRAFTVETIYEDGGALFSKEGIEMNADRLGEYFWVTEDMLEPREEV